MKILVLGLNYAPERVGIAVYTTGMAEHLQAMGHRVEVVAGQPYYPAWKIMDGYRAWAWTRATEFGVDVTRVPHYVPSRPSGALRLLHHATFAVAAFFPTIIRATFQRPDLVLTVAPSLVAAPIARLAALLGGARSWLHIQDFEVEAALATALIRPDGPVASIAGAFDQAVTGSFDVVSTISPQMVRKLVSKGVSADKVIEFRNWANIEAIRPLSGPSSYREEWNIRTPHVALYSGNVGNKQGIEIVVDAARALSHRKDLTFVVCGEGQNRANLEVRAAGLDNIQFHDLQPKERLNELVGLATVHLLPQLASAADLVLPSKLTNMLASGRPVVATAAPGTGLAEEVEGCGIVTPPEDSQAFAAAIAALADDPIQHASLSAAARRRAEERWSGDAILARFADSLVEALQDRAGTPETEQI